MPLQRLAAILLLGAAGTALAANADGTLGFAADIDVDGIFSPTLKSVVIAKVQPGLPAAAAGIAPGDSVVEAGGRAVAGSKAAEMAALMRRKPGESVVLKLRRPSGEHYVVTLKAVAKP